MMWPFILNTVSLWPSVRKWLLILALNLQAVNVKREAAELRDEGSWVSCVPARCTQHHSSAAPPPPVATPELLFRRRVPLCLLDKSYCPHQCLMGENQSYFSRVSLSLFAGMWWLEEERVNGNWMVVTIKL